MPRLFVQKCDGGTPRGRKHRIEMEPEDTVSKVLKQASKILKFSEGSSLVATLHDQIVDDKMSIGDVVENSLMLISEEDNCQKQKTFTIKNSVGKALKIKMDCIHLIYDIEEKARGLFEIAEDDGVVICDMKGNTLDPGRSLDEFDENTLLLVRTENETIKNLTTIFVKKQKGKTLRLEIPGDSTVYDIVEKSRPLLKMNEDSDVNVYRKNKLLSYGDVVDANASLELVEEASDLGEHDLNAETETSLKNLENEMDQIEIGSSVSVALTENEEKEVKILKKKVVDFYRDSLPEGISLGIYNYCDDRRSHYDRADFTSEKELMEERCKANSKMHAVGVHAKGSGSIFGVSVSAEVNYEQDSSSMSHKINQSGKKSREAVVSTICYSHVKKFYAKPILDEITKNTAKKIVTEDNPTERFEALKEIERIARKFKETPTTIPIVPFYCGGSFTIDATARSSEETDFSLLSDEASSKTDFHAAASISGWGKKASAGGHYNTRAATKRNNTDKQNSANVTVTFKHQSKPENCSSVADVCAKLDQGVEYWSLTPDLTRGRVKEVHIDIIDMMKQEAKSDNDSILKEATTFLQKYLHSHNHFYILGSKFTLSRILKQLNRKSTVPVSFLYPSDNVAFSFFNSVQQIEMNEGSEAMFIISIQWRSKFEDNLQNIRDYLDAMETLSLQKVCILVYSEEGCIDQEAEMRKRVQSTFGISNFLVTNFKSNSDLTNNLNKIMAESEYLEEKRCFADYKKEKVMFIS